MSELRTPEPRRVAVGALLQLPDMGTPPPDPPPDPSPEALLKAQQSGHAAAIAGVQPRIEALENQLAQANRTHSSELQAVQKLALHLFGALEQMLAQELGSLAHAAARAVLAAEPALSQATLCALIGDAIRDLPRGTLHIAPDLLESARALCPEGWSLVPRADLAPGTIDAQAGPALQHQSLGNRLSALLDDRA